MEAWGIESLGVNPGSFSWTRTTIRPAAGGFAYLCLSTPCSPCFAPSPPATWPTTSPSTPTSPLPHSRPPPLPLCTQALAPPLIATLASLSELRRLRRRTPPLPPLLGSSADGVDPDGDLLGPPWPSSPPPSPPPPLYGGASPTDAIGTSSAPCNDDAYYHGDDGEDPISPGEGGGGDLSQPLLASAPYTGLPQQTPSSTSSASSAASVFVDSSCNGLTALVLLAALLWPCGAGLPYATLAAATLGMWAYGRGGGRGGENSAAAGRGGSGGSHPVLRLLLLQLYCCTHLMMQYMYQVGPRLNSQPQSQCTGTVVLYPCCTRYMSELIRARGTELEHVVLRTYP